MTQVTPIAPSPLTYLVLFLHRARAMKRDAGVCAIGLVAASWEDLGLSAGVWPQR